MKSYIFNYSIHGNAFSSTASYCEPSCLFHITVQEPSFKGNKSCAIHHCLKDNDIPAKQKTKVLQAFHRVKSPTGQGQQFSILMRITEKVTYLRKFPNLAEGGFCCCLLDCCCWFLGYKIMPLGRYTYLKTEWSIIDYAIWIGQSRKLNLMSSLAKNFEQNNVHYYWRYIQRWGIQFFFKLKVYNFTCHWYFGMEAMSMSVNLFNLWAAMITETVSTSTWENHLKLHLLS